MSMNENWKSTLQYAGAVIENDRVMHFGNPERENQIISSGDILADLSHLSMLSISGDDAATFLQGQLTNDIQLLIDESQSQYSGYCNPQGRLIALFHIFKHNNQYQLLMPDDMLATIQKRLQMYVMMSKVTLENNSDAFIRFGYASNHADERLGSLISELPQNANDVTQHESVTVIRLHGQTPRFMIIAPLSDAEKLWQQLDVHASAVGMDSWNTLDIRAGIPSVSLACSNAFIPQMLNLRELDAINFHKGCYTGQEIVARLQYRGTLKQRMYHATIQNETRLETNTALYTGEHEQTVGHVVICSPVATHQYEALVVVAVAHENSPLFPDSQKNAKITLTPPPYPFQSVKNK